jgi:Helix-loop-helix DNA-binding domain
MYLLFNYLEGTMTTTDESNNDEKQRRGEEPHLPMKLIKSLSSSKRKDGGTRCSESGSSRSNGEGNGHQSDNSALVSVGNTSFGFDFDSEDGNSSPPNSERHGESDSDGGNRKSDARRYTGEKCEQANSLAEKLADTTSPPAAASRQQGSTESAVQVPQHQQSTDSDPGSRSSSTQDPASSASSQEETPIAPVVAAPVPSSHNIAADAAVANLYSIASAYFPQEGKSSDQKADGKDNDSNGGYNTDDEGARCSSHIASLSSQHRASMTSNAGSDNANNDDDDDDDDDDGRPSKKKRPNDRKREERNAREKERSFRISKQINELRALLSTGGVIVPKGTKSSVLTEAANYIRMLQQHQYRSEM